MIGALQTPVGWLMVEGDAQGVTRAWFDDALPDDAHPHDADPHGAITALTAWLAGELDALSRVPVAAPGTPFQQRVWQQLRAIPAGSTSTYRELAAAVGQPSASRAVARANATNPVAVIVPCHRVIGAGGKLRGYAGGLMRKRWLLAHEGAPGFLVP